MQEKLTTEQLRRLRHEPPHVPVDVYDTQQPGLVLRARPNGRHSYRVLLGRGRWQTLGGLELKPDEARRLAQGLRGDVSKARALGQDDPIAVRRAQRAVPTLQEYLDRHYQAWASENRRSACKWSPTCAPCSSRPSARRSSRSSRRSPSNAGGPSG